MHHAGLCHASQETALQRGAVCRRPDVGNPSGFENGGQHEVVKNSVDACINAADGYFVFDICHVRAYNYWNDLKAGIDQYRAANVK